MKIGMHISTLSSSKYSFQYPYCHHPHPHFNCSNIHNLLGNYLYIYCYLYSFLIFNIYYLFLHDNIWVLILGVQLYKPLYNIKKKTYHLPYCFLSLIFCFIWKTFLFCLNKFHYLSMIQYLLTNFLRSPMYFPYYHTPIVKMCVIYNNIIIYFHKYLLSASNIYWSLKDEIFIFKFELLLV